MGRLTAVREPVRVIYTCYGGTHSSPVAAAIHLGQLPRDRVPSADQLLRVPRFDRVDGASRGRLTLVGIDGRGNPVYVVGRGNTALAALRNTIETTLRLAGRADLPLLLVDTLGCVNGLMRIGGYLSRALGLVPIGRPLVVLGTQLTYPRLVRLVEQAEAALSDFS
ncbi:MAG TPA: DUF3189 family protein [Limnochordales bacterium]